MFSRTASIDLAPCPTSVPAARHRVLQLLRDWGVPHDLDDAALLVTELVANAVDHAGCDAYLTVELALHDDRLRIAVADGSPMAPVVLGISQDRPRGRGLLMVSAIADCWGTEPHGGGKRVWSDLRPASP